MMKQLRKVLCLATALMLGGVGASAVEWDRPVPEDCTLKSGEKFYLYNAPTGQFAVPRQMQVSMAEEGAAILFEQQASGDWTLQGEEGYWFSDLDYVGCNGGEGEDNSIWYVEKQASGVYRLRASKNDPDFSWSLYPDAWMGVSYTTWGVTSLVTAEEGSIDWTLVSVADYAYFLSKLNLHRTMTELQGYGYDVTELLAVYNSATERSAFDAAVSEVQSVLEELRIEHATEEHPCDVTAKYVRNADLTENWVNDGHDVPGWTMVPATFCGMGEMDAEGFYSDNKTLGSWSGGAFGDNKVYQQLSGLKNGKYKFGNYGLWIRHTGEEGDPITGAYIYAKVGEKLFREPLADTGWWRGLSEVVFECRTGEAEVGIMFEGTNVGQCIILDFKLEYLGEKPAAERLNALIAQAQVLVDEGAIHATYIQMLSNDIKQANELIASGDIEGQEALFATFQTDCEEAVKNQEAYVTLAAMVQEAENTISKGDSEAMEALLDYLMENELTEKLENHALDNVQIEAVIKTLAELTEKAANSVIAAGTDVTDLLVNGRFDTTGGWTATLNDFSIDPGKKILEKWWTDWKAEQVINNVANGTYRLEVQGFQWCSWDWSQSETDWVNGDGSPTFNVKSKVRLNNDEVTIHNVFACGPTDIEEGYQGSAYWVPNDATTALKYFALGLYNNVVETTVTDNTLKVEFDCSQQGFWNCFTNLRLLYVGADKQEAIQNLKDAMDKAEDWLAQKMDGSTRKAIEDALAAGKAMLSDTEATYDHINGAANTIVALFDQAAASVKAYTKLGITLDQAAETLKDERAAATEAGQKLQTLYETTKADYEATYPSLDQTGVDTTVELMEKLMLEAKLDSGVKAGADITHLIANASFENTYGNDVSVGNAAHTVPYGWAMMVEGKECHTAQELTDAGINSWTAIEDNDYTTDGAHSYCLLSAPVPDAYLFQTLKGLPAGTYRVTVDMNVTYDGGCSRLTGQRLLVNNVAQYYGKAEFYIESTLDELHPEEVGRSFAGYEEVNTNDTGASGDMGNMQTLAVEVTIGKNEALTFGVRTDNNKEAMNRSYENNWWDCTGRYKIDNFRLYCMDIDATGIEEVVENRTNKGSVYNLMGIRVNPTTVRGIYIQNGKKYQK
ncbi:MAG: hypothetical protein IJP82_10395 [Bacteroidaceae bacterium]|nr:hypothetical protein [Bacteroidaceae bacterium]